MRPVRTTSTGLRAVTVFVTRRSFFFQAEDGIRDLTVTGVQTCALPISHLPDHHGLPDPEPHHGADRIAVARGSRQPEFHIVPSGKAVDEIVRGAVEVRSEEHTSELQSQSNLVCRLLLEKKKYRRTRRRT